MTTVLYGMLEMVMNFFNKLVLNHCLKTQITLLYFEIWGLISVQELCVGFNTFVLLYL